jgi:hypothetical protein
MTTSVIVDPIDSVVNFEQRPNLTSTTSLVSHPGSRDGAVVRPTLVQQLEAPL